MSATEAERATSVPPLLVLAVIGMLLAILSSLFFIAAPGPRAPLSDCREVSGALRRASQDYYLANAQGWSLLHTRCTGKTRAACLKASDHAEDWLESHLGDAISAHRCQQGVVDYTVAARTFHR